MTVTYNGRKFEFRPCDTRGVTPEHLQQLADRTGKMEYEPNKSWLLIPSIGYGWDVTKFSGNE